jgi:exosome complex RNA-binding protein Rrp4
MPTFFEAKQLVTPGELLAEGDYQAGENAYTEAGKVYASRIGLADLENKKVNVVALRAFYSDVLSRPFKPQNDELSQVLDTGDLIVAKIASYDRAHDPQLTVGEPGLGKITRGQIMRVTPTKIPRVIGRKGSMISMIKQETNCQIILGLNGVILVTGKTAVDEDLAMSAIKKIEDESHTTGLTDRITQLLKEEKAKREENKQ